MNWKFEKEFREANPETVEETDKHFDLDNYKDFLEKELIESRHQVKKTVDLADVSGCYIENNKQRPTEKSLYEVIYSDRTFGVEYWDGHSWKVEKPVVYWRAK